MCHSTSNVRVTIPSDLNCSGDAQRKEVPIDACIAPIVDALQRAKIDMRGSCCGHGRCDGHIQLADGRALLILPAPVADWYFSEGVPLLEMKGDAFMRRV
jgi:hypothetical protein